MKNRILISIIMILLLHTSISAQQNLTVTSSMGVNPQTLLNSYFAGEGVAINNVKFNNSLGNISYPQIGIFQRNGYSSFPFASGIVMTTGEVFVAQGPNNSTNQSSQIFNYYSDYQLNPIATDDVMGCASLDFDFVAFASDTIAFNYIFASEEYPEYVCSEYNDAFAFFLTGPDPITGVTTTKNIAIIPNTVSAAHPNGIPVTINSVNNGSSGSSASGGLGCYYQYSQYYFDNQYNYNGVQYDGYTRGLSAQALISSCQTYHMHLAIGNVGDNHYDSGVFFEQGSFSSPSHTVEIQYNSPNHGDTLVKNCRWADLTINLPRLRLNNSPSTVSFGGNAVLNQDYELIFNGSPIIPSGPNNLFTIPQDSASIHTHLQILPTAQFNDNQVKEVILYVSTIFCQALFNQGYPGAGRVDTLHFYLMDDRPVHLIDTTIEAHCLAHSLYIRHDSGLEPLSYSWIPSQNISTPHANPASCNINQSGIYNVIANDSYGCHADTGTVNLIVHPAEHNAYTETACEHYLWHGTNYSSSGVYTHSYGDADGCLIVDTLHLNINNPIHQITTVTSCVNYTWTSGNGQTYTQSGNYRYTHEDSNGCTQTDTLHLTINYSDTTHFYETICQGEPYNGHGFNIPADSTIIPHTIVETRHATSLQTGCDSVINISLTVLPTVTSQFTASACGSYIWNTTTYTASGDYQQSFVNHNGCDSTVTLHLTIFNPTHQAENVVACETYNWTSGNGQTYTVSGNYTYSHTDSYGCTQVDTLHLTINNPVHQAESVTTCESFTWTAGNGQTFTSSGNYLHAHPDANQCTQVDTLHLTITHSTHNTESLTACETFNWHNTEYTESGTYTYNYTNDADCPSVDTLHLTINHNVQNDDELTICNHELPYSYGNTVFPAGTASPSTFNLLYTTVGGCDSLVSLTLHIIPESVTITNKTSDFCEEFQAILEASSNMPDYYWSTGETAPSITVTKPGTYMVTTSDGNCFGNAKHVIPPCDFTLFMPNSITASNPDGLNDIFQITEYQQMQIKDEDFSVVIYDRWGAEVFHSYYKTFQWDGKIGGRVLEGNTYIYHIKYKDFINRLFSVKGTVITF